MPRGINPKGGSGAAILGVADSLTGEIVPVEKALRVCLVLGEGSLRSYAQKFVGPRTYEALARAVGLKDPGTLEVSEELWEAWAWAGTCRFSFLLEWGRIAAECRRVLDGGSSRPEKDFAEFILRVYDRAWGLTVGVPA